MRPSVLAGLCMLFCLSFVQYLHAETYTLSVGESVTISQSPYGGGYIDNVGLADYLDPHLGFTKNYDGSATIMVNSYFDYTATVHLVFIERYTFLGHTRAETYYRDVDIKCKYQTPAPSKKPTKVILPERIRVPINMGSERFYVTPVLEPYGAKGTEYYWGNSQGTAWFAARPTTDGRCWITGRSPGIGKIYVVVDNDWDNLYASAILEVVDPNNLPPNSVFLPNEIELSIDGHCTLFPILVPENTSTAYTWKSDDESVATVSFGKVVGKKTGTTTITVKTSNELTAKCTVKVISSNGKDDEDESNDNTKGTVGGHDYIDLGLSVKWATCNVGSTSPEDYGDYFAWGETKGRTSFSWENYEHCDGSILSDRYIGNDIKGTQYDAAFVNWGSDWRMPTDAEVGELISKCTFKQETINGVEGYLATGPNGNSIFLPNAGQVKDQKVGTCYYWSSTVYQTDYGLTLSIFTDSKNGNIVKSIGGEMRCFGQPIRAVTEASGSAPKQRKLKLAASPSGGEVSSGTTVYLTANADGSTVSGCDIYYTLNGNTPTTYSTKYTSSGITITSDCTLKAIAYKDGYEASDVLTATYTIRNESKNYYIVGGPWDWSGQKSSENMFTQTSSTCYTITFSVNKDWDTWFAFGDDEALDAMANESDWSKLYGTTDGNGNNGFYGTFARRTSLSDDAAFRVPAGCESITMSIDFSDMTFRITTAGEQALLPSSKTISIGETILLTLNTSIQADDNSINWTYQNNGTVDCRYEDDKTTLLISGLREGTSAVSSQLADGTSASCEITVSGYNPTAAGNGSWENPFNSAGAFVYTSKLPVNEKSSDDVYIKGKVIKIVEPFGIQYGNSTFYISSDGNIANQFYVYRTLYIGNRRFQENDRQLNIGDEVLLCGKVVFYENNSQSRRIPETVQGECYIVSINGEGEVLSNKEITLSSAGYATFYSSESAYQLPTGLSASVVSSVANNKLTYRTFAENVVPKGVPVMIESDNKRTGTYTLTPVESNATYTGQNLLRGSDEATTTTGNGLHYKLSYGPRNTGWSDVFGWYWGAQNGGAFQIDGHRAWLVLPRSGTRAAGFTVDGDATMIDSLPIEGDSDSKCFDLQGRRVAQPAKKGLYISNGRKVVIQ